MKSLLISYFVLFVTMICNAQLQKLVYHGGLNHPSKMAYNHSNGDVYIAIPGPSSGSDYILMSYSSNGNFNFSKHYSSTAGNPGNSMNDLKVFNDTIYVVCDDHASYCFIHRFDLNGNFIDGISLPRSSAGWYDYDQIIYHNNALFVLISDGDHIRIIKLSAALNVVWAKYLLTDPNNSGKNPGFAITPCNNDDIVITAKADHLNSFIRLDSLGNIVWSKTFNGPNGGYNHPKSIVELSNGNIFISGLRNDDNYPSWNEKISAIMLNNDGEILWTKGYILNQSSAYTRNIHVKSNGNIMLLGPLYASVDKSFVIEVDEHGNVISSNFLHNGLFDDSDYSSQEVVFMSSSNDSLFLNYINPNHIKLCQSENIAISSYDLAISDSNSIDNIQDSVLNISASSNQMSFVANLQDETHYICGSLGDELFLTTESLHSIKMAIHPNPTSNQLHVTLESIPQSYQILDLNGKLIITENLNEQAFTIDVQGLPMGMYILQIQSEDGTVQEKFVVE